MSTNLFPAAPFDAEAENLRNDLSTYIAKSTANAIKLSAQPAVTHAEVDALAVQ